MLTSKMIGDKIAEARKKVNISQAQLAERLFISAQAVGKWERGESMPDIIMLNRLCEILGVNLNYFSGNSVSIADEPTVVRSVDEQKSPIGNAAEKPNWNMSQGNWVDADFSGLKNLHEKFSASNMLRCKFNGSDLSGLILKANNVDGCDFSVSNISNSRIQSSNFLRNIFTECSLKETDFSDSNIEKCDLTNANLSGTKFLRSNLYGCNLSGTDFTGVTFKMSGFSGVEKSKDISQNTIVNAILNRTSFNNSHIVDLVFTGTLQDCYFENCKFTRVVFQNATLVNTFFKNNRYLKRIKFIDCKADRMTFEFLKQGKADLTGITMIGD